MVATPHFFFSNNSSLSPIKLHYDKKKKKPVKVPGICTSICLTILFALCDALKNWLDSKNSIKLIINDSSIQ